MQCYRYTPYIIGNILIYKPLRFQTTQYGGTSVGYHVGTSYMGVE